MDKHDLSHFSTEEIKKELKRRDEEGDISRLLIDQVCTDINLLISVIENFQFPVFIGKITSENAVVFLNQVTEDLYILHKQKFSGVIKFDLSLSLQQTSLNKKQIISYLNKISKK